MKNRIEEKIHNIAEYFMNLDKIENNKLSLFSGSTGISLFLFYYSRLYKKDDIEAKAMDVLYNSVVALNTNIGHSFCEGISGICWCINHLIKTGFIEKDNKEVIEQFDNYLARMMVYDLENGNNDFLHGAIGTALYLLEREKKPHIETALIRIIELLQHSAFNLSNKTYWKYNIGYKDRFYDCNISLSHGMSSTVIFLIKFNKTSYSNTISKELLSKSINFILSQEIKDNNRTSMFPSFSLEYEKNLNDIPHSRLGWCYGDLGIGLAIWQYYKYINDESFKDKAIEILLFSSRRKNLPKNSVIDGGICHGTIGIALIFKRIYLETNINEFKETYEYWMNQTLLMAKYDDGILGYKANLVEPSLSLLDGVAGIGLGLLSLLFEDKYNWDESLLLI